MKQRIVSLFLTLIITAVPLSSCQRKEAYTNDQACRTLMEAAIACAPTEFGYDTFEETSLPYRFDDGEEADDACVRYSIASENINEIGIFHSPDTEAAKEIYDACEDYLEELLEEKSAFIASYAAEELPKLERAEVRRFGNYTVYAILSDEERSLVFSAIEQALLP